MQYFLLVLSYFYEKYANELKGLKINIFLKKITERILKRIPKKKFAKEVGYSNITHTGDNDTKIDPHYQGNLSQLK